MPSSFTLARLDRALRAEQAAEQAASSAEQERRATWWETTWLLAACPRDEWANAQARYVERTGHNAQTAKTRRRVGATLTESTLAGTSPAPRFAQVVVESLGRSPSEASVQAGISALVQAEADGLSLREFSQQLTGRPWTNTAENLTEADEDAIVERAAQRRPEAVAAVVERTPAARQAVTRQRLNTVIDEQQRRRLVEQNRQAAERGRAADERMRTRLEHADVVHHEATRNVRSARMWLRKAAEEYERNPLMSVTQRADTDLALAECEHLISLLRGESDEWTETDREFLTAVGIEGDDE